MHTPSSWPGQFLLQFPSSRVGSNKKWTSRYDADHDQISISTSAPSSMPHPKLLYPYPSSQVVSNTICTRQVSMPFPSHFKLVLTARKHPELLQLMTRSVSPLLPSPLLYPSTLLHVISIHEMNIQNWCSSWSNQYLLSFSSPISRHHSQISNMIWTPRTDAARGQVSILYPSFSSWF